VARPRLREQSADRRALHEDFLHLDPHNCPHGYRRVLMTPPFATAVQPVKHALGFLDDDGTLVAVLPEAAADTIARLVETSDISINTSGSRSLRCAGCHLTGSQLEEAHCTAWEKPFPAPPPSRWFCVCGFR